MNSKSKLEYPIEGIKFILKLDFWGKYLPENNKTCLKKGWTEAFNEEFEKKYDECTLAINYNRYYHAASRKK